MIGETFWGVGSSQMILSVVFAGLLSVHKGPGEAVTGAAGGPLCGDGP